MSSKIRKNFRFISGCAFCGIALQALLSGLLIAEDVSAQNPARLSEIKVSLEAKKVSIKKVLFKIQEETGFNFLYKDDVVENGKKISIIANDESLETVLASLSKKTHIGFRRINENIYVSSKKPDQPDAAKVMESFQQIEISGKVTDENGNPVPGVNVAVKNTNSGTITDIDGVYKLTAEENGVLIFTYIGYKTIEVGIRGRSQLDVELVQDYKQLEGVVVVGYGTKEKVNLTGSVVNVDGDLINKRPITQASQALQGLAPGVFVNTNSGEPGNDQATIIIRGIGTLNNAEPLVLIDGIEAPINSLNPNDIESVNVLKDAASASIYGTRAANGVVLITTKRGSKGKPSIIYDFYAGITEPTVLPDLVNDSREYLEAYRVAADNTGRSHIIDDELISEYAAIPSTDWMDRYIDNGSIQSHNLAVSGGSDRMSYRWSTGYLDQDSFFEGDYYFKRLSNRLNLDLKLADRLSLGTSLAYVNSDGRQTPKDDGLRFSGRSDVDDAFSIFSAKGDLLFTHIVSNHPHVVPLDEFGRYGGLESGTGRSNRDNPEAIIDNMWVDVDGNEFLGNAFLEYEIIDGLKLRGTVGINYQSERNADTRLEYEQFNRFGELVSTRNRGSSLLVRERSGFNITNWFQATYEKEIGSHAFKLLAGINRETSDIKQLAVLEEDFGSTELVSIGNGAERETVNFDGEWRLASQFGRLNYSYDDRYLLEFNIRRDGSSRFGSNNRWATFPGISVGYILSNESFWDIPFIDFLKFRASWGRLGVQSNNLYPFASQFELGADYNGNSGGALTRLGNPDLQWEETTTTNFGVDISFWEGRISIEAEYYTKDTDLILTDLDNPLTAGITSRVSVNAASLENKGWDLGVNFVNNFGQVRFTASLNLTNVQNEITSLNPNLADEDDIIQIDRADNVYWIRGQPINAMLGHEFGGIFQEGDFNSDNTLREGIPDHSFIGNPGPGDIRYTDQNGDGVIDVDDRVVIGNRNPEWLYGFNFGIEFKGFDCSALFQGIGKADVYISRGYGPFAFAGLRRDWVDNQYTAENPSETNPRLWVDRDRYNGQTIEGNNGTAQNSFWVQNRAYLRLKNIQLGYTLPDKLFSSVPIQRIRVYLNGQNLWTNSDLDEIEPDRNALETYATAVSPQARMLTIGLNANF